MDHTFNLRMVLCCLALALSAAGSSLAQAPNEVWIQGFDGPGGGADYAYDMTVDDDGNVYVTGSVKAAPGSGDTECATVKYDSDGYLLWESFYGDPSLGIDYGYAVTVDGSGNVYVAGTTYTGSNADWLIIKYDASGNETWHFCCNGPGDEGDFCLGVAVDGSGNVFAAGPVNLGVNGPDYGTIKLDADGNQLWFRRHDGPGGGGDYPFGLALDGAGNVLVAGYANVGPDQYDYGTVKYDSAGTLLWASYYNGPDDRVDYCTALTVDDEGNAYVTGSSGSAATRPDMATVKYNPAGDQLWAVRYNGPADQEDEGVAIALDDVGNVIVLGSSDPGLQVDDMLTVKYDSSGSQLWTARYDGPLGLVDSPRALALDGDGNIFVSGVTDAEYRTADRDLVYTDFVTLKYAPDGVALWEAQYGGPDGFHENACGIAVDSLGDVVVAGDSLREQSSADFLTLKYREGEPLTVGCDMACAPASGTLPFTAAMSLRVDNLYSGMRRRMAVRLDLRLAGGQYYPSWRAGSVNIAAGGWYFSTLPVSLPALPSTLGVSTLTLRGMDVSPSPYNQPPYPPAGDMATAGCALTGYSP